MSELKAVLWDLDGTILDSLSVAQEVLDGIFPRFGLPILSREKLRSEFYGSVEDSLVRMSGNYSDQAELWHAFNQSQQSHYEKPVFHEHILETITQLGALGVCQAIITSRGNKERGAAGAHKIVENTQLRHYISVVISADECEAHKPNPQPLLLGLRRLNVAPENSVMIGDQPVDALAALNAGVHSILIDHEKTTESYRALSETNPHMLLNDGQVLLPYIRTVLEL